MAKYLCSIPTMRSYAPRMIEASTSWAARKALAASIGPSFTAHECVAIRQDATPQEAYDRTGIARLSLDNPGELADFLKLNLGD